MLYKGFRIVTGVLHENDIDYHVATMLGIEVVSGRPFQQIGEKPQGC
ncbi:MAG: hypothetical protein QW470_07720 [Candidatus Caldarchaeum sp.]